MRGFLRIRCRKTSLVSLIVMFLTVPSGCIRMSMNVRSCCRPFGVIVALDTGIGSSDLIGCI